jgi:maleate isomerase
MPAWWRSCGQGPGYHLVSQKRLAEVVAENKAPTPIISSAGALIDSIGALGAKKVAIITPYMKPLTRQVINCIESAGIEVTDSISLEVSDNLKSGGSTRPTLSGMPTVWTSARPTR